MSKSYKNYGYDKVGDFNPWDSHPWDDLEQVDFDKSRFDGVTQEKIDSAYLKELDTLDEEVDIWVEGVVGKIIRAQDSLFELRNGNISAQQYSYQKFDSDIEDAKEAIKRLYLSKYKVIKPDLPSPLSPLDSVKSMLKHDPKTNARYKIISELLRCAEDDLSSFHFKMVIEMEAHVSRMEKTSLSEAEIGMMKQSAMKMIRKISEIENATRPVVDGDLGGSW